MRYSYWFFLVVVFISCNSKDAWDCVQTTGSEITFSESYSGVSQLSITGDIDVEIYPHQPDFRIELVGGENLIDDILLDQKAELLQIKNLNTCGLMRNQAKPLTLKVFCDSLSFIEADIVGALTFMDTLRMENFKYILNNSTGSHNLLLEIENTVFEFHAGLTKIDIAGRSNVGSLYSRGNNEVDASKMLFQDKLELNKVGDAPIWVNSPNDLFVLTLNAGEIHLAVEPDTIYRWGDVSGELIFP